MAAPATSQIANLNYVAIKRQTTDAAVIPDVYVKSQTMPFKITGPGAGEDTRIAGNLAARQKLLRGLRRIEGEWDTFAEPNVTYYHMDMLYGCGVTTGSNPYTTPILITAPSPKQYTMDVAKNGRVERYIGVESDALAQEYSEGDNTMHWKNTLKAKNCWVGALILSASAGTPTTINLKTTFDPSPTTGLVVGDVLTIKKVATSTYVTGTVAGITDGDTITVTENLTGLLENDEVYITPDASYSWMAEGDEFEVGRHTLKLASTVAGLAAASDVCAETDTSIKFLFPFEDAQCIGNLYMSKFRRLLTDAEITVRRLKGDDSIDMDYINRTANALQFTWLSGLAHSLVVTADSCQISENENPLNSGEILYHSTTYKPGFNTTTTTNMGITLINSLNTA